jgi:O-antigen/teichoic acid export membrane protein
MGDTEREDQREPELSRADVRTRASAGIFFRTSSGVLTLLIGFFGNLVLARILTPKDFGIVAIGATVTLVASALADGGLASGLIRRADPPTRDELRTLSGIQLAFTLPLSALLAVIASRFGTAGLITGIMVCSVPLSAFQAPGRVILNRRLLYSRVAMVELVASVTYYGWAITGAALGYDVWAMATATVVRAIIASAAFAIGSPFGFIVPTLHRAREFGEIIRFGLKFQSGWITVVVREQILNATTAIVGGVSTLGLWSLARRLIELPTTLVDSINTVTFPTMSHLLFREDDPRPLIEKTTRYSAITLAVFLSAFAASSIGLVPFAFGDRWAEAAWAIPPACLGLAFAAPASAGATGYLFASGVPGRYVWITVIYSAVWIVTSAALLPFMGVAALGVGWIAGGLVEASLLERAVYQLSQARMLAQSAWPIVSGTVGGLAGLGGALSLSNTFFQGLAGAVVATVVTIAMLALTCRVDLFDVVRTLTGTVRDASRVGLARGESA